MVASDRQCGELRLFDSPPMVFEDAPERWRIRPDIPEQPYRSRVKIGPDRHGLSLFSRQNRFDRDIFEQSFPAPLVDIPDRGSNLRVGIGVNIFEQEVDQTAVALQNGEDA